MDTVLPDMRAFMRQEGISKEIRNINEGDIGLWAIWTLQEYARWSSLPDMVSRYGDFLDELIHYYLRNVHPNLRIDDNGLCVMTGDGRPLSWMDAKINGQAVVRREGYLVEVNALWYNALCFYREALPQKWTPELEELLGRVQQSFCDTFINQHGYLFDYVHPHSSWRDWSVRPNMVFATSLPYSPLPKATRRSVLEIITRELRTPKGLRSPEPKERPATSLSATARSGSVSSPTTTAPYGLGSSAPTSRPASSSTGAVLSPSSRIRSSAWRKSSSSTA